MTPIVTCKYKEHSSPACPAQYAKQLVNTEPFGINKASWHDSGYIMPRRSEVKRPIFSIAGINGCFRGDRLKIVRQADINIADGTPRRRTAFSHLEKRAESWFSLAERASEQSKTGWHCFLRKHTKNTMLTAGDKWQNQPCQLSSFSLQPYMKRFSNWQSK